METQCVCASVYVSKCPYVGLLCSSENGFDTSDGMHGPEPTLSVFLFGLLRRQKRVGKRERKRSRENESTWNVNENHVGLLEMCCCWCQSIMYVNTEQSFSFAFIRLCTKTVKWSVQWEFIRSLRLSMFSFTSVFKVCKRLLSGRWCCDRPGARRCWNVAGLLWIPVL